MVDAVYDIDVENLIDIPVLDDEELDPKITIHYEYDSHNKIRIRKKQLFDQLDTLQLTYVKGGICDSFIKYGYPSLDKVINDVQQSTTLEDRRLEKLVKNLEKRGLKYDSRVTYYREYVEQGTDICTAIREGKREWFLINKTAYLRLLTIFKDEERAEEKAIQRYLKKYGYTQEFRNHLGRQREFEMKICLY